MVVHAYYPLGETRVERQASALVARGFEVEVISLKGSGEPSTELVDGVTVHRLPVRRNRGSGFVAQFIEYLLFFTLSTFKLSVLHLRRRFDVVQVHNLPDFLVFAALVPKLTGAKIVLDLHDLMPEFYAERIGRSMESLPVRFMRLQERVACAFADKVITVTEIWRQALVKRGIPAEKVFVVMNLADPQFFYQNGVRKPPADGKFNLIYHGIMGRRHGLDLALMALDKLRDSSPSIHLTLHGGGEFGSRLEEMVAEMGLQEQVTFSRDFMPTAQLADLIRSADLGIVPYRDDTFTGGILPTKLLEYAALGLPAIAARTSCMVAYFDESMVAFFDPGDADQLADQILRLSHERVTLDKFAENITAFNRRYNWGEHSQAYVRCIQELGGD